MNPEEAFEVINGLFWEKANASLSKCQRDIILGIWQGKTYQVISDETFWRYQTVKGTASDLFKQVGEFLKVEVNKANFVNTINHFYQQNYVYDPPTQVLLPEPNNPFNHRSGGIDNPQQFFDRGQIISRIFEILNSGSSVALIGEEGIGKSSLLHAVCQLAESKLTMPRQPILLDLNGIDNKDDFYRALCNEADIPESTGYQLKRNLAQRSEKLLLALDNVGQMTSEGFTRQVRDRLRGLAEGSNAPLKLILAANVSLNILFDDSQEGGKISPLAGICLEETIEPWDEPTIRNFIEARLARTVVRFTEAEISQLVQESGGHPRRLMQGCYRIYAQYKQPGQ